MSDEVHDVCPRCHGTGKVEPSQWWKREQYDQRVRDIEATGLTDEALRQAGVRCGCGDLWRNCYECHP